MEDKIKIKRKELVKALDRAIKNGNRDVIRTAQSFIREFDTMYCINTIKPTREELLQFIIDNVFNCDINGGEDDAEWLIKKLGQ